MPSLKLLALFAFISVLASVAAEWSHSHQDRIQELEFDETPSLRLPRRINQRGRYRRPPVQNSESDEMYNSNRRGGYMSHGRVYRGRSNAQINRRPAGRASKFVRDQRQRSRGFQAAKHPMVQGQNQQHRTFPGRPIGPLQSGRKMQTGRGGDVFNFHFSGSKKKRRKCRGKGKDRVCKPRKRSKKPEVSEGGSTEPETEEETKDKKPEEETDDITADPKTEYIDEEEVESQNSGLEEQDEAPSTETRKKSKGRAMEMSTARIPADAPEFTAEPSLSDAEATTEAPADAESTAAPDDAGTSEATADSDDTTTEASEDAEATEASEDAETTEASEDAETTEPLDDAESTTDDAETTTESSGDDDTTTEGT